MIQLPLDDCDYKLLDALQRDASLSRKRLAELCHISEATCSRRIASLKKHGYLTRTTVILDPAKFGLKLTVFVLVAVANDRAEDMKHFAERLRKIPAVLSMSLISGDFDYLLRLAVRDMAEYQEIAEEYLARQPYVRKYLSCFEMKSLKHTTVLPLLSS